MKKFLLMLVVVFTFLTISCKKENVLPVNHLLGLWRCDSMFELTMNFTETKYIYKHINTTYELEYKLVGDTIVSKMGNFWVFKNDRLYHIGGIPYTKIK